MPMPVPPGVAILVVAAALIASCSSTTGGAPVTQPATGSPPTASAPIPTASVAAPPPPAAVSDEEQIRQTVAAFQDAYNSQNWEAYLELMCAPMRAAFTGSVMDFLKRDRAKSGVTTATITAIAIDGDTATVTMNSRNEAIGSAVVSLPLKREEDGWKICQRY